MHDLVCTTSMKKRFKKFLRKGIFVRRCQCIACLTILNLFIGIYMTISIISAYEPTLNDVYPKDLNLRVLEVKYDYYFLIDYTIIEGICQPIELFNTIETINSIENMTNERLDEILIQDIQIDLQIIKLNVILENTQIIKEQKFFISWTESRCDYRLELYVGIDFSSNCNKDCQSVEIDNWTLTENSFQNSSLKFCISNRNLIKSSIEYSIESIDLYRTAEYLEKLIYIRSIIENRSISISNFDLRSNQASVSLSKYHISLFLIKKGLDLIDASTICISFAYSTSPDYYLHHSYGKIVLSRSDESILFKQDATFKLIYNPSKTTVAFQAINLPDYFYLSVDNENNTSQLILVRTDKDLTIDQLDDRYFFQISYFI